MYLESDNARSACGDGIGTLPGCAPLAVPYVPMQQENAQKYSQADALANGTLFPGLNLPFHVKVSPGSLPRTACAELQAMQFVLVELGLYLDTHKEDKEAFQLFQKYAAALEEGKKRYEAMYGPLTLCAAGKDAAYEWLDDPWPWEYKQEGAGK